MSNPIEELVGKRLTPQFVAMNGRDKWEMLVLHGLIGTDEPWIAAMTKTLREEADALTTLQEALRPFAKLADDPINHDLSDDFLVYIRLGDCRKARLGGGEG